MTHRTPYYSYDLSLLQRTLTAAIQAASVLPSAKIHYALKANHNPILLKKIASNGFGADCVSGGEIKEAISAGFKAEDIFFAGVGKTDSEIRLALREGIGCFNVESLQELEVLSEIASRMHRECRVAIRINPNVSAHTIAAISTGKSSDKFGIGEEGLPKAVDIIKTSAVLKFMGIHLHIGSQILDMEDFRSLSKMACFYRNWFEDKGLSVKIINVGGGLGVDYGNPGENPIPDFKAYFDTYAAGLDLGGGVVFHCELGRSIVAQCGSLITRCLYVKEGGETNFIIVDAGMNDLVRPAMYGARHRIENLSSRDGELTAVYDVVGPVCESTDCFVHAQTLPVTKRGDILAIRSAGAYGESMASTYNSRPLPGYSVKK